MGLAVRSSQMIPKQIVMTGRSFSLLTPIQKRCFEQLKRLHPDFEVRFFADLDCRHFIADYCPDLLPLYDFYHLPIQKADVFRVVAVYALGGFYFDLDVYLHDSIHPLISSTLVLAIEWEMTPSTFHLRHRRPLESERELSQIGNYAFGATRSNRFLRLVIEEMVRRTASVDLFSVSRADVLYSTGPDLFSDVFYANESELRTTGCKVLRGGLEAKPPKVKARDARPEWFQFGTFGNHLMVGSWTSASGILESEIEERVVTS